MQLSTYSSSRLFILIMSTLFSAGLFVYLAWTTLVQAKESVLPKTYARGIDASHYQGIIRWHDLSKDDIHYVFVKATGGNDYVDPQFINNWHGARQAGLYRGAYHFFYADDEAETQAKNFIETVGPIRPHDLPPVLDVEILDHMPVATVQERALKWLELVEAHYKRTPILYTGAKFAKNYLNDHRFARFPLWIAEYEVVAPDIATPWQKSGWHFWQYTSSAQVVGIATAIDLNRFQGSVAELEAFIRKTAYE